MTSPSSGYRAVCSLCQTVIVSPLPRGQFIDYDVAVKAMHAHLLHSCDKSVGIGKRERAFVADGSVEVCEGAA